MKRLYHVCITSHNEVMFRDEEDYLRGINSLAIICVRQDVKVLSFSFQSDHVHLDAFLDDPGVFVKAYRNSYTHYFNRKYSRKGCLGESSYFAMEVRGLRHTLAVESYIIRNAVHHGLSPTPFGYPFNSSKCYFSKEIGHSFLAGIDFSKYRKGCFLPPNRRVEGTMTINPQGMIAVEQFVEIQIVEHHFGSARAYQYYMGRLSSEEWAAEQREDPDGDAPIGLADIERVGGKTLERMLRNEKSRTDVRKISDMELCGLIDDECRSRFNVASYACLPRARKIEIFRRFQSPSAFRKYGHVSEKQLSRCLALEIV